MSSSSDELPSPLPATRPRRAPDRYSPSQYGLSIALTDARKRIVSPESVPAKA
jgi:hypothetical protein